jgi:hypothetical protein
VYITYTLSTNDAEESNSRAGFGVNGSNGLASFGVNPSTICTDGSNGHVGFIGLNPSAICTDGSNGLVEFGASTSIINQGEIFEGETIDFTLQRQMCSTEHIGTTGHPFHIHLWRTAGGAVHCKDVEHDIL